MTNPKYNANFHNNEMLLTITKYYSHLKLYLYSIIILQYRTLFKQTSFSHQL